MLAVPDSTNLQISTNSSNGFELWFQPVYCVPEGTVIHNEVLLRWRDTRGNLCYPKYFMPLFAQAKQQPYIDRLVIQKTIQVLIGQPDMTLAVNLSDQILDDFDIIDDIADLLQTHDIHPRQLSFEISEIAIAQKITHATSLVRHIKELGCSVILDDFANRYLSFLQWERLNVDAVKVESTLLQGFQDSLQNALLIQSIVDVSDRLGLTCIAKFFDSSLDSSIVARFEFDAVQGFHRKPPSRHPCFTKNVNLFGVPIDNWSQQEFLSQLRSGVVFTPDVEHLIHFRKNQELRQAYTIADYKICDSNLLVWVSKLLGYPIKKISGSDFFSSFYQYHQTNSEITIFLLGGSETTLAKAKTNINQKVGRPMVVGTYSPRPGCDNSGQECQEIVQRINRSKATVLAIGSGAPNPELWIYQHRDHLSEVKIILTVGATLDLEANDRQSISKRLRHFGTRLLGQPKQTARPASHL